MTEQFPNSPACSLSSLDSTARANYMQAGSVARKIMEQVSKLITSTTTEADVAAHIAAYLEKAQCTNGGSPIYVAFGENSLEEQWMPSDSTPTCGEVIVIDFSCEYNGCVVSLARTFGWEKPSTQIRFILRAISLGYQKGIDALREGASFEDVVLASGDEVVYQGYNRSMVDTLTHTYAPALTCPKHILKGSEDTLVANEAINYLMAFYPAEEFAARFCDTFIIEEATDNDNTSAVYTPVTNYPSEFVILGTTS